MSFDPGPAADAILRARVERRPAGPLPRDIAPQTIVEAAATQFAIAGRLDAVPPGGFKIGATGARMRAYLGLDGPAAGFMERRNIHESGARFRLADLRDPAVECELAVRLSRDLQAGECDEATARDAIGELSAAIEVVENRYGPSPAGDLKAVGTPTLIADQVYHRAAVVGPPGDQWRTLDLVAITGRISDDNGVLDQGRGSELLGDPVRVLAWLAASDVAAAFGGLRAGQVVMLGSVTPPIWVHKPGRIEVAFDGLPHVHLDFT